jgi:hypothetical protein
MSILARILGRRPAPTLPPPPPQPPRGDLLTLNGPGLAGTDLSGELEVTITVGGRTYAVATTRRAAGEFALHDFREIVPVPEPEPEPEPGPAPQPEPGVDKPPKVKLKSPRQGARFGRTLKIVAEAGDDERIARVDLYVDSRLVDRDSRSPYQDTWRVPKRLAYGSHSITAKAYDSAGQAGAHSIGVTRVKDTKAAAKGKRKQKHRRKRR